MSILNRLNWKHKLAAAVLALGLVAALLGNPYKGHVVTLDTRELALIVQNERDHIAPLELADWIIAGRSDYRLIDTRSAPEFADYHIPGAENITPAALSDAPLLRNEKIVLYSDGGIHAAQAWMLLAARGYKHAYLLRGGLEAWRDEILFPALAENATPAQKADFEKVKAVSLHFGGAPQTGGAATDVVVKKAMPKLETPAGGAAPSGPAGGKKKKEGC